MPTQFGPGIWTVDGPTVKAAAGFHYPTRMTVMRLAGGEIVLWSPTEFSAALREALEALGPVRYLVAPNTLHHIFLADWQRACPDAMVLAAPGLREKRADIAFDGDLDGPPIAAWEGGIDLVAVGGNRITTEIVCFHRQSGTVVFTDLLQHFPPGWFSGWQALVARLDLMVADEASVPRKFRLAFTDRRAAREAVRRILAWPAQKVLMAHGAPVREDGRAFLRRAFAWLGVE